jgi:hypothetical protein
MVMRGARIGRFDAACQRSYGRFSGVMALGKNGGDQRAARSRRLADALRVNLRRRKVQARGRALAPKHDTPAADMSTDSAVDKPKR